MLSRFHLVPERNGQTDGQTNLQYQYPASVRWRAIKIGRSMNLGMKAIWPRISGKCQVAALNVN